MIIGTEFQIDRKDPVWTGVDVSPYLGYKFSDRFRANVGGTYRVTFDTKTMELSHETESYGYRAFGNYKIINGLFAHLEVENMYRVVPPYYATQMNLPDPENPIWVPRAFVGLYKTYTISKHFNGQTQILYDFLDVAKNFQFNKVAFRFGFEYKFVKKSKDARSKVKT